jgi:hypothetical protein
MSDRTQIGPTVDSHLWERFREDVRARHGQVRGVLGDELENAIREYLQDGPSPSEQEIIDRLARIERTVGTAGTDGGADTSNAGGHTHAPSRLDSPDKPAANAATDKKVAYLAECVLDEVVPSSRALEQVPRDTLVDVVKAEYGFRSDTARRYVDRLVEWFDLREHPSADGILVTEAQHADIIDREREQARDDADEQLEQL